MEFIEYRNMHHMILDVMERGPERVLYTWFNDSGAIKSVSGYGFYVQARHAAMALMALGIEKGENIAVLGNTSYKWVQADLAAAFIGACTVGIYPTATSEEIRQILSHSESVAIFVENETLLKRIKEIKPHLPLLRNIILMGGRSGKEDWIKGFDQFMEMGEGICDEMFKGRVESVSKSDLAAIFYKSSPSGVPMGVMITHDNLTFAAQSVAHGLSPGKGSRTFLYLPLANLFARVVVYSSIYSGVDVCFPRNLASVREDFQRAAPDWFASVPVVLEAIYSQVMGRGKTIGTIKKKYYNQVGQTAMGISLCFEKGIPVPRGLKIRKFICAVLTLRKLKKMLGGKVKSCLCGGGGLNPDIVRFFHGSGVFIQEGYYMNESTSFIHLNRRESFKVGSSGTLVPGVECKISAKQEVMIRGRNVMKGYYKMPGETGKAIDQKGWIHPGITGKLDSDGFLWLDSVRDFENDTDLMKYTDEIVKLNYT